MPHIWSGLLAARHDGRARRALLSGNFIQETSKLLGLEFSGMLLDCLIAWQGRRSLAHLSQKLDQARLYTLRIIQRNLYTGSRTIQDTSRVALRIHESKDRPMRAQVFIELRRNGRIRGSSLKDE